jgi:hypothetical protein
MVGSRTNLEVEVEIVVGGIIDVCVNVHLWIYGNRAWIFCLMYNCLILCPHWIKFRLIVYMIVCSRWSRTLKICVWNLNLHILYIWSYTYADDMQRNWNSHSHFSFSQRQHQLATNGNQQLLHFKCWNLYS